MDKSRVNEIADVVRQVAYEIHVFHGHGYFEKIYENALVNRLRKRGFEVQQQVSVQIFDEDGTLLGTYVIDVLVEGLLLVEIKVAKSLAVEHTAQLLGYLKSSRLKHGLLINFGASHFQIRKFASPFSASPEHSLP